MILNLKDYVGWNRPEADRRGTQLLFDGGSYHLACFVAQQVAEKALKAFIYAQGEEFVIGHSVEVLCRWAAQFDADFGRNVPRKPRLGGGIKGHNINDITLPGSPALIWAGSFANCESQSLLWMGTTFQHVIPIACQIAFRRGCIHEQWRRRY